MIGARSAASRPPKPVVSGLSVGAIALGIVMLVAGSHRSPIADVLKAAIKGEPIPRNVWDTDPTLAHSPGAPVLSSVQVPAGLGGSAMGRAVAADAITYVGKVPYSWAHATPSGWDCSGMVTWILHHDFGINLPNNNHTLTGGFLAWTGASVVARKDVQPGDLACWPGHIGIVIDDKHMVAAASPSQGTIIDKYDVGFPIFKRPNAYASAGSVVAV